MTKQRRLVLDIVNASRDHLTADGVCLKARESMPSIAVGTVYRNLNILAVNGDIRRIPSCGADRYDRASEPHDHAICVRCGRIFDIPKSLDPRDPKLPEGAEYLGCEIVIRCLCRSCREE